MFFIFNKNILLSITVDMIQQQQRTTCKDFRRLIRLFGATMRQKGAIIDIEKSY